MTQVVIAGGGLTGLAASIFLARRGHTVTVVERDEPPPDSSGDGPAGADADVAGWRRAGAPQCRQSHVLLGRVRRVLLEEAPDVVVALLDRGVNEQAVTVGLGGAPGEAMLLGRRLVIEAVLRRVAEREPGIDIRSGDAVVGLRASEDEVPVVTGVRTQAGDTLDADVVVDAGGRRSALPHWLADIGARPPVDEVQPLGFFYLTRYYRLRPGCVLPVMRVPGSTALDYATVLAFRGDNDTFSLSLTLSVDDPHRLALRDPARHQRFLEVVPLTAPWLEVGDPISDISVMARIENRKRRLVDASGPVVGGLVAIGDASLHTNPTLGRGVAMGFCQAQQLARSLAVPLEPLELVRAFDSWTEENLGIWYDTQTATDGTAIQRLEAGLRGERLPAPEDPQARFIAGAFACAEVDAVVGSAVSRIVHLLQSPVDALGSAEVSTRIGAYLASHSIPERPPDQPTRGHFVDIATQ